MMYEADQNSGGLYMFLFCGQGSCATNNITCDSHGCIIMIVCTQASMLYAKALREYIFQ